MTADSTSSVRSIAAGSGGLGMVWIENQAEQQSGGIYLFQSLKDAQAYVTMHTERLAGFGITGVQARYFDVNEPLSILNHASLLPAEL